MADYPSLGYTVSATKQHAAGRIVERTDGGAVRVRAMYAATKRRWDIEHYCTPAEAETIYDHFAAHLDATFSFTDQATDTAHTVIYGGDPATSYASKSTVIIRVALEEA